MSFRNGRAALNGVWGLRPQRVQGRALAFSLPFLGYFSAYGALPWTR